MSQDTFSIANQSRTAYRAAVNVALQALASVSSGATAPGTPYAYQLWADTASGLLKQRNAANSAWIVRDTLAETFVISRAANTILGIADRGRCFVATAAFTQTLTAAATLGDGWWAAYRVEAGISIVIDPNSTETIDGATTKTVLGPSSGIIFCTGGVFNTIGFATGALLPGSATNDAAAAGNVGEYISSTVVQGSALALVTATNKDITSIALTAGDWDVSGVLGLTGAFTTMTYILGSISNTSVTIDATPGRMVGLSPRSDTMSFNSVNHYNIVGTRVSVASPTTLYLVAQVGFAAAACLAFGIIQARRVR